MALFGFLRRHGAKIVLVALLAAPLAATFTGGPAVNTENRALAGAPGKPHDWASFVALPPAVDAWIADHVGWRTQMIELYTQLRYRLFRRFATHQVVAGRDGRIFLGSHNPLGDANSAIAMACGWDFRVPERIAFEATDFMRHFDEKGLDVRLLVVPSGPIVHAEQLPAWMAARCAPEGAPAYKILASPSLPPRVKERMLFPLAGMRAIRSRVAPFPLTFFHWSGAGPRLVAGMTQEAFWQRPAAGGTPIPLIEQRENSDIHWLFPGIELPSVAGEPDFTKTAIRACTTPECFPGMEDTMRKMVIFGRYTNGAPGLRPRLVLVTDSFGERGAPWFARYYSEVVYVSTNSLKILTKQDIERLRALLYRPGMGDEILYLYHDATVYSGRIGYDLHMLSP